MINCHNFRNFSGKSVAANPTAPDTSKGKPIIMDFISFLSVKVESPNLLSARQQPQVVDQKLAKELEAHRLAGPSARCLAFSTSEERLLLWTVAFQFRYYEITGNATDYTVI